MAKKKLYGAALASFNRARSKTALVRRSSSAPAVIVTASPAGRRRVRRAVGRIARRGAGGIVGAVKAKLPGMAASAAYGYLTKPTAPVQSMQTTAPTLQQQFLRIPVIDSIGRKASHGLLFHAIGAYVGGTIGSIARHMGDAALYSYAFDFGRSDGSYEDAAKLSWGAIADSYDYDADEE